MVKENKAAVPTPVNVFFAKPGKYSSAIDVQAENGNGLYSGMTLQQLEKEYGQVEIITPELASERIEAEYTTLPEEITEERFWYLLDVLPPCKWFRNGASSEAFHVSERVNLSIVTWAIRIGPRYFSMDRTDKTSPAEAITMVKAKIASELAVAV